MSINFLKTRPATLNLQSLRNLQKCCYATKAKDGILGDIEIEELPAYEDEPKYSAEEIDRVRNKSRLWVQHRNILNEEAPYTESHEFYHNQVWYKRRMLGRYGINAPNVNPAWSWPTKAEIEDIKEYENLLYPEKIQDLWKQFEEKKIKDALEIKTREEQIDKVVANFDKWRAELKAKIEKKEAALLAAKQKKEAMLEELREQFGFKIDLRDERFQEMLELKEKEDKKKKKEERKKMRTEKMLAYLYKQGEKTKVNDDEKKTKSAEELENSTFDEGKIESKTDKETSEKDSKKED